MDTNNEIGIANKDIKVVLQFIKKMKNSPQNILLRLILKRQKITGTREIIALHKIFNKKPSITPEGTLTAF